MTPSQLFLSTFFLVFSKQCQRTLCPRDMHSDFLELSTLWRNFDVMLNQDFQNLLSVYFSFYYGVCQKDMKYYHQSSKYRENSAPSNNSVTSTKQLCKFNINSATLDNKIYPFTDILLQVVLKTVLKLQKTRKLRLLEKPAKVLYIFWCTLSLTSDRLPGRSEGSKNIGNLVCYVSVGCYGSKTKIVDSTQSKNNLTTLLVTRIIIKA